MGEQERKFAQLLESFGEKKSARLEQKEQRDVNEKGHKDAAEHSIALQPLDQRLELLERIFGELVSSEVHAGVNCSVLSGSVPERLKAEPPKKKKQGAT